MAPVATGAPAIAIGVDKNFQPPAARLLWNALDKPKLAETVAIDIRLSKDRLAYSAGKAFRFMQDHAIDGIVDSINSV